MLIGVDISERSDDDQSRVDTNAVPHQPALQDLEKAAWYLMREIDRIKK